MKMQRLCLLICLEELELNKMKLVHITYTLYFLCLSHHVDVSDITFVRNNILSHF